MKNIRQQRILDWLADHGHAALGDLTAVADAKRLTIQRDLVELERAGQLKRIRGGAVSIDQRWLARSHETRIQEHPGEKATIGVAAARLLAPYHCIGLDGSSTCTILAPLLARAATGSAPASAPRNGKAAAAPRTVLATSIETFNALRNLPGIHAVLSGGILHSLEGGSAGSLVGHLTEQSIKSFRFDAVCLSALAFDPALGVFDSNGEDVAVKLALMSVAQRVFLLLDHSKWTAPRGVKVCDTSAIHTLVTDRQPSAAAVKALPKSVELVWQ